MPLTTPTVIVDLFDISGGWVPDASQYSLQPNELVEAENVEYDIRGGFRVRAGYDNLENTGVVFIHFGIYTEEDGSHWLVGITADGSIWADVNLSLIDTTSGLAAYVIGTDDDREYDVSFAQLRDYLYISSRRGNTWRFDGTTWLEITDSTLNGAGVDATPEFPQAKTTLAAHGRVFAGNTFEDGASFPSRLRWSTLANGQDQFGGNRWEASTFVDVNEADGSQIQAIHAFQSQIIVFKDDSLHVMAGDDTDNFTLLPIDESVGTTMSGSIASDQSVLFFLDQGSGVYMFDGVSAQRIDEQVNKTIMDIIQGFTGDKLFASAYIEDHKYFLCLGQMDGNRETFVFDMRTQAWTHWDMEWRDLISYRDVSYMAGQDGVSSFRDRTFLDDDAVTVSWSVKWAWIPAAEGQDMRQYRMRRADVHSQWVTGGAATYSFDMFADNDDTTAVWTNTAVGDEAQERFPGYDGLFYRIMFHCHGTNTAAVQTDRRISGLSIKLSGRESKGSFAAGLDATLPADRDWFPCFDQPTVVTSTHVEGSDTPTKPVGADGDVLVLIAARASASGLSVPAGYTEAALHNTSSGDSRAVQYFFKQVADWSAEVMPTLSAATDHLVALSLRNVHATHPFVAQAEGFFLDETGNFESESAPGGRGQLAFRSAYTVTADPTLTDVTGTGETLVPGPDAADTGAMLIVWEILGVVNETGQYVWNATSGADDYVTSTVVFSG